MKGKQYKTFDQFMRHKTKRLNSGGGLVFKELPFESTCPLVVIKMAFVLKIKCLVIHRNSIENGF
jgi:hypothetical protein